MTRTSHGHHIPGTTRDDEGEIEDRKTARCGGVALCKVCREEALKYPGFLTMFTPNLNLETLPPPVVPPGSYIEKDIAINSETENDPVNHPSHYTSDPSGVEAIEITRYLSFNVGNAVKYVFRHGKKDSKKVLEDLDKAIWYLNDEIKYLGKRKFFNIFSVDYFTAIKKVIDTRETGSNMQSFFICIYGEDLPAAVSALEAEREKWL